MSKHNETKMTGAQCLIRALEDAGVKTVFGYPGGHALDIYDALYDSSQLNHILVRHEQGAVHAADGYARATGKVGTVIVTSGPGATNTVTGIATAYMDSIPLVVITGQVPTDALGSDAFFPFGDNIERAHRSGVTYVAQPGGSIRDDNVIDACNLYNMVMCFTHMRLFHH